jgi:uncharacterized SAM-binding protein YcdF (DUF218 family)
MLFYLKKFIAYFLEPFSILLLCLFVLWYVIDKKHFIIKRVSFFVIVFILCISSPYFSNLAVAYWSKGYNAIVFDNSFTLQRNTTNISPSLNVSLTTNKTNNINSFISKSYVNTIVTLTQLDTNTTINASTNFILPSYIVILGGDFKKRTWEGVRLFYANSVNNNMTIITLGYQQEALNSKQLLLNANIPNSKIVMFDKPKTTYEEAKVIKNLLGNKKFILVTSSYHMKRASAIFSSFNLNFSTSSSKDIIAPKDIWFVFKLDYFYNSNKIMHEFLGLAFFKVRAFIDEIFSTKQVKK